MTPCSRRRPALVVNRHRRRRTSPVAVAAPSLLVRPPARVVKPLPPPPSLPTLLSQGGSPHHHRRIVVDGASAVAGARLCGCGRSRAALEVVAPPIGDGPPACRREVGVDSASVQASVPLVPVAAVSMRQPSSSRRVAASIVPIVPLLLPAQTRCCIAVAWRRLGLILPLSSPLPPPWQRSIVPPYVAAQSQASAMPSRRGGLGGLLSLSPPPCRQGCPPPPSRQGCPPPPPPPASLAPLLLLSPPAVIMPPPFAPSSSLRSSRRGGPSSVVAAAAPLVVAGPPLLPPASTPPLCSRCRAALAVGASGDTRPSGTSAVQLFARHPALLLPRRCRARPPAFGAVSMALAPLSSPSVCSRFLDTDGATADAAYPPVNPVAVSLTPRPLRRRHNFCLWTPRRRH